MKILKSQGALNQGEYNIPRIDTNNLSPPRDGEEDMARVTKTISSCQNKFLDQPTDLSPTKNFLASYNLNNIKDVRASRLKPASSTSSLSRVGNDFIYS